MYEKVIEKNDDVFWAWYNIGNSYRSMNEGVRALEMYREAMNRRPNFLSAYKNSAVIYIELMEYDRAINIMDEFIEKYPNDIDALFHTAAIYHQDGNLIKAEEYIRKVLNVDPDNELAKELLK